MSLNGTKGAVEQLGRLEDLQKAGKLVLEEVQRLSEPFGTKFEVVGNEVVVTAAE